MSCGWQQEEADVQPGPVAGAGRCSGERRSGGESEAWAWMRLLQVLGSGATLPPNEDNPQILANRQLEVVWRDLDGATACSCLGQARRGAHAMC